MLTINIPESQLYDEESETFFTTPGATLLLEHSLVSLSKWESIWNKPFLNGKTKTSEETRSYVAYMNLAPVPSEEVYKKLSDADVKAIAEYIDSSQTATWFKPDPTASKTSSEAITGEIIYYWMIAHTIPFEAQYWHLNRLITLIKVCNEKNKPAKRSKMGSNDLAASRRALNEQRRAELGTAG